MSRTVILHYHLFKNAGTSVDRILKHNFPNQWVTTEFAGSHNTKQVADWIKAEKTAVAFSSHTMMGPIPEIDGVKIYSILFLRDPISRIVSAYNFERQQQVDTLGAQLAKDHDLDGYVQTRLTLSGDRQCRDFQTYRLAAFVPGAAPELDRAKAALSRLSFIGTVETFSASIKSLEQTLKPDFPRFSGMFVKANATERPPSPLSPGLAELLERNNRSDRELLRYLNTVLNVNDARNVER